jgi:cytochrome c-type biogenesis protein CcmH
MVGWLILFALVALVLLALWRLGKLRGAALQLSAAALLFGVAGYAWQGSPGKPGDPTPPKTDAAQPDSDFAKERAQVMGRFGNSAQWLDFADALHRMNRDRAAVTALKTALTEHPNDPDLWVGLGNALVIHGGGLVTPAARLAFERAAKIAPEHPGPPFFMGLAYAQAGQPEKAVALWQELLAKASPNAPWRADLEQRLAQLQDQAQSP